jgi:hypothetical protein
MTELSKEEDYLEKINRTSAAGTLLSAEDENGESMNPRPPAVDKTHEINKGYTFFYMITIGIGMLQFGRLSI